MPTYNSYEVEPLNSLPTFGQRSRATSPITVGVIRGTWAPIIASALQIIAELTNSGGPQGFTTLNIVGLITGHSHNNIIVLGWRSWVTTFKKSLPKVYFYHVKYMYYMGIK